MKGLLLYGIGCQPEIWKPLKNNLSGIEFNTVIYPHSITQKASSVSTIAEWVLNFVSGSSYDFIVGHSMGGIIALMLASEYQVLTKKVLLVDTNLKPAEQFYQNLLLPKNNELFGSKVQEMLRAEMPFYTEELKKSLQVNFDFTELLEKISVSVHAIYGDRGHPEYSCKLSDLCLSPSVLKQISVHFVPDACHMPMIENPSCLAKLILSLL